MSDEEFNKNTASIINELKAAKASAAPPRIDCRFFSSKGETPDCTALRGLFCKVENCRFFKPITKEAGNG